MPRPTIDGTLDFDTNESTPQRMVTPEPGAFIDKLNAEAPRPVTRFNAFGIYLINGESPTLLLGADVSRKRFLITGDEDVSGVMVGTRGQLSNSGIGMLVPKNATLEMFTTEEIWVRYSAVSGGDNVTYVYLYVENRD